MNESLTPPVPEAPTDPYIASLYAALDGREPLSVLRETPARLAEAIAGLGGAQLARAEAPGKWSMVEVLQHLADAELVGGFRFRMVLAHDRPPLQAWDQNVWATRLRYDTVGTRDALDQFTSLRFANLKLLERTTMRERARVGIHAERGEESVAEMMKQYAGHDLVHLKQLARIRAAVGG